MIQAACTQHDPNIFEGNTPEDTQTAIAICQTCPVLADCRRHILAKAGDEVGIWAALTEHERRKLRGRQHKKTVARDSRNNKPATLSYRIGRLLNASAKPLTTAQIATTLDVDAPTVKRSLYYLTRSGQAVCVRDGVYTAARKAS
jgi:WhiB family redox-sensing transcriptional regulator